MSVHEEDQKAAALVEVFLDSVKRETAALRERIDRLAVNLDNTHKTHCRNGHELTGNNVLLREGSGGRKARSCRICTRARGRESLRRRRREAGVGSRPDVTDVERQKICDLRRSGMSHRQIARTAERALTTIQRVLKEAGL